MRLFHGTTTTAAQDILEQGLRQGTCVTPDEGLAWYYAEAACDEAGDEDEDYVVVVFEGTLDQLVADKAALAEPVGWGTRTGQQIDDALDTDGDDRTTLESSLDYCASARLTTHIAASDLAVVS